MARSDPEARSPTSLHCRLVRRESASAARPHTNTPAPAAHCAMLAHAHARARSHARARTIVDERRDVRSAGVADWNISRGGGIRSVRSPPRRALSSRPLSPCPCNAAAPKGPAFLFLKHMTYKRPTYLPKLKRVAPLTQSLRSLSVAGHKRRSPESTRQHTTPAVVGAASVERNAYSARFRRLFSLLKCPEFTESSTQEYTFPSGHGGCTLGGGVMIC